MITQVIDWLVSLSESVTFDKDLVHSHALAEIKTQIYERLAAELGDGIKFPLAVTPVHGPIALLVERETGRCKAVPMERNKHNRLRRLITDHECTNKRHRN